ncbi:cupin domain-containing protein [Noviherbaspirillum pedocola]|uniref:Cupin domain-containing protein n=1 Tax=Noviherbaspirillum pedocola TaxID=2801341 RepID=A0A934STV3_9BURK|nr:cupin domain-containing protein [Noviherbaspirillum pedocola]MBK4736500.1 cupin domain-containing protein [Noviherbaspirillum pedocola]
MQILSNHTPAPTPIPGIAHVTLAGSPNGLRDLSVWKQSMEAGRATPLHRHASEEVVLCIAGVGELHAAGRIERVHAGQTIVIPAGVDHQLISVGPEPLETIAAFPMTPVSTMSPQGEPLELPWQS